MRRTSGVAGFLAILLLCACPDALWAQTREDLLPSGSATRETGRDPRQFVSGDTIEIVARRGLLLGDRSVFSRYPFLAHPDLRARRPVPVSFLLRPRTIELSRFACAIQGVGLGAGTASSLGGLGLFGGLWGEKTTGYLIGAGAILGAVWGGTAGAENAGFRMRVGMDASDPAASRRRPLPDDRRP